MGWASWFFAPTDGRLVSELRADPAAVAAYRAEEGFTFVSVSGRATLETDEELKERYWLGELERWFPNGPSDPNVTLIRLDAEHADWWTEEGDGSADLRQGSRVGLTLPAVATRRPMSVGATLCSVRGTAEVHRRR